MAAGRHPPESVLDPPRPAPSLAMTRPTFLVVGAMKCGTTSLWRYLRTHPEVATADTKELHFFSRHWDKGWAWYEDQFANARAAAVGEASPSYAELHYFPEVPGRIADGLPEVRIIYLVRDPIARLESHYLHNLDRGFEDQPLTKAVWATPTYTGIGRYATHVAAYLSRLPAHRLLVVRAERLRNERLAALDDVATFLGISDSWSNVGEEYGRTPTLRRRVRRDWRRRGPIAGGHAVLHHFRYDHMARLPATLRAELVDYFRPEVEPLRSHLDAGFDGWGLW